MSERLHKGWLRLRNGEKFSPNVLSTSILTQENERFDEIVALKSDLVQSDWLQTDETELDFIKNRPEDFTKDDALLMLAECGIIDPIADIENAMYMDKDNKILLF